MKPLAFVAFVLPTVLAATARAQDAPASPPPAPPGPPSADATVQPPASPAAPIPPAMLVAPVAPVAPPAPVAPGAPETSLAAEGMLPPRSLDRREGNWRIETGYRGTFIPSAGYQPFSTNGYLPEFSLAASRTMLELSHHLSLAVGLAWDEGSSASTIRQVDQATLSFQRVAVTLEGRMHLGTWGYAYLRVAPGAAMEKAQVEDQAAPAPLEMSSWLFAADVSGGYSWLMWPRDAPATIEPRVWLQGEGGYGFVGGQPLALQPALPPDSPVKTAGVNLGTLEMRGGFFRVAAAVSF